MRIAIKDANIIIDLIENDLIEAFFKLDLKIITSDLVIAEIKGEAQKNRLSPYLGVKLEIISIFGEEFEAIADIWQRRHSLSIADCSVYYLAEKNGAMILTGDKPLRNEAEANSIESHGMLWILDRLVEQKIISPSLAAQKLIKLQESGSRLPKNEIDLRLKKWKV